MAGFKKAKPMQAAIKMSKYGPPGSGKTFTALLFAEGIAQLTGKRIAFLDSERGTDFYAMPVPARKPHPEAFDFDVIYTRSLVEANRECRSLDPNTHGIIIVDSISHFWETAMNSYNGPKTKQGTIPMWAWSKIKAPYKELMKFLIDSPFHVFILGRQANVFEEDEVTGETKAAGVKMRAEGETAYEPHICLHMVPERDKRNGTQTICAIAEKDRSGVLAGKRIEWPNFNNVIKPILSIMGTTQGSTPSDEEAASFDAESYAAAEREKSNASRELVRKYLARFQLAEGTDDLRDIGKELTPTVKKQFTASDLKEVRDAYEARNSQLKGNLNAASEAHELGDGESHE